MYACAKSTESHPILYNAILRLKIHQPNRKIVSIVDEKPKKSVFASLELSVEGFVDRIVLRDEKFTGYACVCVRATVDTDPNADDELNAVIVVIVSIFTLLFELSFDPLRMNG